MIKLHNPPKHLLWCIPAAVVFSGCVPETEGPTPPADTAVIATADCNQAPTLAEEGFVEVSHDAIGDEGSRWVKFVAPISSDSGAITTFVRSYKGVETIEHLTYFASELADPYDTRIRVYDACDGNVLVDYDDRTGSIQAWGTDISYTQGEEYLIRFSSWGQSGDQAGYQAEFFDFGLYEAGIATEAAPRELVDDTYAIAHLSYLPAEQSEYFEYTLPLNGTVQVNIPESHAREGHQLIATNQTVTYLDDGDEDFPLQLGFTFEGNAGDRVIFAAEGAETYPFNHVFTPNSGDGGGSTSD